MSNGPWLPPPSPPVPVVRETPGAGPRIMVPHEGPPGWPQVAPPPQALGNVGPEYGIQARQEWAAGRTEERQVIDVVKAEFLWRISVFGNVLVSLDYGTKGDRHLLNLLAPVVLAVPGQLVVRVRPVDEEGASCRVTLTKATGGPRGEARNLVDATLAQAAFSDDAVRFVALVAATANVAGIAIAVGALETVPLVAGSVLLTGSGFQEFEA